MDSFFDGIPRATFGPPVETDESGNMFTTCKECGGKRFHVFAQNPWYGECKDCRHIEIYPKHPMDKDGNMYEVRFPGDKRVLIYKKKQPRKTTLGDFL